MDQQSPLWADLVLWWQDNIQNIEATVGLLLILGGGALAIWRFFFKKPIEGTAPPVPHRERDLHALYYAGLDASCERLKLKPVEKGLGQQLSLSLSAIYHDQQIRCVILGG